MTGFNIAFDSCWYVKKYHVFFPFIDIPFNKSMGVEYILDAIFVKDSLVDLRAFISVEEIVGASLILFLSRNSGVTSLRSTVSILLLISHQTTTWPCFSGTGDSILASCMVLPTFTWTF